MNIADHRIANKNNILSVLDVDGSFTPGVTWKTRPFLLADYRFVHKMKLDKKSTHDEIHEFHRDFIGGRSTLLFLSHSKEVILLRGNDLAKSKAMDNAPEEVLHLAFERDIQDPGPWAKTTLAFIHAWLQKTEEQDWVDMIKNTKTDHPKSFSGDYQDILKAVCDELLFDQKHPTIKGIQYLIDQLLTLNRDSLLKAMIPIEHQTSALAIAYFMGHERTQYKIPLDLAELFSYKLTPSLTMLQQLDIDPNPKVIENMLNRTIKINEIEENSIIDIDLEPI